MLTCHPLPALELHPQPLHMANLDVPCYLLSLQVCTAWHQPLTNPALDLCPQPQHSAECDACHYLMLCRFKGTTALACAPYLPRPAPGLLHPALAGIESRRCP